MTTYQLLAIARDARLEGRLDAYEQVLGEIGIDAQYVKFRARQEAYTPMWLTPFARLEQAPTPEDREEAEEDNRRERQRCIVGNWQLADRKWWDPSTTVSYDSILREHYTADTVARFAPISSPLLAMLPREQASGGSFFQAMRRESEAAIENLRVGLAQSLFGKLGDDS